MYNTYYLRCIAADYDNMIQLGVLLGALQVTPAGSRTYERPGGEYVEVPDPDYDPETMGTQDATMMQWVSSGVMEQVTESWPEHIGATNGGCYDLIGTIHKPTGETVETEFGPQPVMVPRCDPDGNPYVHANLITTKNLREAAEALAAARPEIAAGLADLSKYFVTDADGNAVAPAQPHRVFAT